MDAETMGKKDNFKPVMINGGGYVTGLDIAADGTMVCRTDVFGAYLNTTDPVAWQLVTTTASLPPSAWGFSKADYTGDYRQPVGVYEIRIAAGNTSVFYMMMNGKMYFTSNKGKKWVLMGNFPNIAWAANENDSYRTNQKKMGIDPNAQRVVYIGTPADGLFVTTNGLSGADATFSKVEAVPVSTAGGITGIVFDPSSGVTGPETNRVYVCSYGHGVYTTADAGNSWALIPGSPSKVFDAVVHDGVLHCATPAGIQEWSPGSGVWNTTLKDGGGVTTLAINPFDPSWVACMGNGGGNLNQNTGEGWAGPYYQSGLHPDLPPSDAPWLADTKPGYPTYAQQTGNNFVAGCCCFDPVKPNRFWIAWGYGVAYTDLVSPAAHWSTPIHFISACHGIQDTVACCAISPPQGSPLLSMQDVQFFRIVDPDDSPTSEEHGTGVIQYGAKVQLAGWSLDWSQSSDGVVAALVFWNGQNASSYSTDYGQHWTQFPKAPTAQNGGCITCVDAKHFIAVDAHNSGPVYSADGGNTWAAANGLPASGWPNFLWNNPQILCNDAAGIVYAYCSGKGLYSSSDKGATFALVNDQNLLTGSYGATGYNNPKLSAVPGSAGHLLFGSGYTNGPFPQGSTFWQSTDGGANWSSIPNVKDVWCHGYGQPYPECIYPTLWIVGWVKVGSAPYKYGIWRSKDLGASDWTWLADYPAGHYDMPRCISGDGNHYDKCYIGFLGSSYMYGKNLT